MGLLPDILGVCMVRGEASVAVIVAICTALCGMASPSAALADEASVPAPHGASTGTYIVLLDEQPAALYDGSDPRFEATAPLDAGPGDASAPAVTKYRSFLVDRQQAIAEAAGVARIVGYQTVLNGFAAQMSPEQAADLDGTAGVQAVYPDELRHPAAVSHGSEVGVGGAGVGDPPIDPVADALVADALAGDAPGAAVVPAPAPLAAPQSLGGGVVVGVVDTGIAPEHPSFAGAPLGGVAGAEPWLDGRNVTFTKADGGLFRSEVVTGNGWGAEDFSTKVIGARTFSAGADAAGIDLSADARSPRDAAGHGSHVAGIAVGDAGVSARAGGVELGSISGIAPEARLAVYKACFAGVDPLASSDDTCVLSDLLAAIDAAVHDGVDVLNYSIAAGNAGNGSELEDLAFRSAAHVGVFVAVSAGDGASDTQAVTTASAWTTTVAASATGNFEGTVRLGDGFAAVGTTVSIAAGQSVTAPVVVGDDVSAGASAALCFPGSLDAARVQGRIVVCDRGTNDRLEKSQVVADAGGVGMILVNVTPGSLDYDLTAVPTVHLDSAARDALVAGIRSLPDATASLIGGNSTAQPTWAPQLASFSRPGSEENGELAPDVTAPGVGILAASSSARGEPPAFAMLSGTSMAAAHVAGLAAQYLERHPAALPAEISSALMTTAGDTVDAWGTPTPDAWGQGAGEVDAARFLSPNLVYEAAADTDSPAAIVIGALASRQTLSRTVTAARPGSYTATASVPGVAVTIEPSVLAFDTAGQSLSFSVTVVPTTALAENWSSGFLTWTAADDSTTRVPLVVRPITADAPTDVVAEGTSGATDVTVTPYIEGDVPLRVSAFAPVQLLSDPDGAVSGHSGDHRSGGAHRTVSWTLEVPAGSLLARFELTGELLDEFTLTAYRVVSGDDLRYDRSWRGSSAAEGMRVDIDSPPPGTYLVTVRVPSDAEPGTWDATTAVVPGDGSAPEVGLPVAQPAVLSASRGATATFQLGWAELPPGERYLAIIDYGESAQRTVVTVDTGPAGPTATTPPVITGDATVGETLHATAGAWDASKVGITYQWLRDGQPLPDETGRAYTLTRADIGSALSVRVVASVDGVFNRGTAESESVFVTFATRTTIDISRYRGTTVDSYAVTVRVSSAGGERATGTVQLAVDGGVLTGTLASGSVTFPVPRPTAGLHVVVATYLGNSTLAGSTAVSGFAVSG